MPRGRPLGSQNKVTRNAKEMLEMAADQLGGLQALVAWGRAHPDAFWPVWAKLLPKNVDMTSGGKPINLSPEERLARLEAFAATFGKR